MKWLNDVQYALRTFRRAPGFTVAAVLTLALGIGANTAIFSAVNGILLRPLPFPEADRIYAVWNQNTRQGIERDVTSYPNFRDWQDRAEVWDGLVAVYPTWVSLTGEGDPEQVRGTGVTADFLRVFRVPPAIGRDFSAEEMVPGGPRVVLLSARLHQGRFGGDPGIIGRAIHLSGEPYTVIGVMPPSFAYPLDAELWRPLAPAGELADARSPLWLAVVGRLGDGVRPELAQQRISDVAAQLAQEYPASNTGSDILIEPLHETIVGDVRTPLLVLLGGVLVVLLIGCANVANLLLARGAVRQRELSIRMALGAHRGQVAAQLLTESVVLSVLGGALGLLFAAWALGALVTFVPPQLARLAPIRIDGSVLLFTTAVSVLTGLLFGLAPMLQARRQDLLRALRDGGRGAMGGGTVGRLRPALVASEVALALVLLVTAGLLIRSVLALTSVTTGFATDNALTFRVTAPIARYDSPERIRQFHTTLHQRLAGLSGVTAIGAASSLFLPRLPGGSWIVMEGESPPADDTQREAVVLDDATPGLFEAFGMEIRRGRALTLADDAGAVPVAIVNEAFVRRYLPPDAEPVGRRFAFGNPQDSATVWLEIAGVVGDARRSGLAAPARPEAYLPHLQSGANGLTYVVRYTGEVSALIPQIRRAAREVDPLIPIANLATIEQLLSDSLAARRFVMSLLGAFAALGLLLAALGIYGVVSYLVAQRRREVGVRIALGATRADVLRLVVGQSLRHLAPGIVLGGIASVVATRLLRSQLFGVTATDSATYAGAALIVLLVGALASYLPAHRAARTDPQMALRDE
ncbi:MAG: ABC transporter permease [Gemmatimonadales bacterium]